MFRAPIRKRYRGRGTSILGNVSKPSAVIQFKRRRFRPKAYKRRIWNDTLYTTHFRSVLDNAFVAQTQLQTARANGFVVQAVQAPFWQVAGGAQPANVGGSVPDFSNDITLRGGLIRVSCTNESNVDTIRVKVFLVKTNKFPNNTIITTANMTNISSMWDPTVVAGNREYGKVIYAREAMLMPDSQPFECFYKLGVQKIDQDDWVTNYGNAYTWLVLICKMNITEFVAAVQNVRVVWSHNLSFSGDAIT